MTRLCDNCEHYAETFSKVNPEGERVSFGQCIRKPPRAFVDGRLSEGPLIYSPDVRGAQKCSKHRFAESYVDRLLGELARAEALAEKWRDTTLRHAPDICQVWTLPWEDKPDV